MPPWSLRCVCVCVCVHVHVCVCVHVNLMGLIFSSYCPSILQTILPEKKKLLQQWNSTLVGVRRRDEAYAAMLTAIR